MAKTKTLKGKLLAIRETDYWTPGVLEKFGICDAFGLYLVPRDKSGTVDVAAIGLQNNFHFYPGTPEVVQDAARGELGLEGVEPVAYLDRASVEGAESRFAVNVRAEKDKGQDADDAWREAEFNGFGAWPSILDESTYWQWVAEKAAARRALNVPPIANFGANGLDNLPLFVAAANALLEAHKASVERLARMHGDCAAHKAQKARLYAAGLTWPLPSAGAFRAAR